MKTLKYGMLTMSAAFFTGLSGAAHATGGTGTGTGGTAGPNLSDISGNIIASMSDLPGVLSAFAYLMGIGFAMGGVIKLKDHVDNPTQHQLKDAAIRLAVGGALFSLPFLMDVMNDMISSGDAGGATKGPAINRINSTNLLK